MGDTIHIIHHADWDGIVAAWVVVNEKKQPGRTFKLYAINYGQSPPNIPEFDNVYILDFAFPPEVFKTFCKTRTGHVVMLDHHKTAVEAWQDAGKATEAVGCDEFKGIRFITGNVDHEVIFHDGEAGCVMTELYLHGYYAPEDDWRSPGRAALIAYAADHDLWLFKEPNSKAIRAAMHSYPQTLKSCNELHSKLNTDFRGLVVDGEAILRLMEQQMASAVRHAELMSIRGYRCWAAQVPFDGLISEVAGRLAGKSDATFGVCWFKLQGNKWNYSLRSRDDFDVSDVAKQFPGGDGHTKAAGFQTNISPVEFLVK